jgi:hypothetical protein
MHENKNIFFQSLDENRVFLIPDLYLYSIKIQTNIKQNFITKYTGKSLIFLKIFFLKNFETGPDLAKKTNQGRISYRAGLSPAAWAGLMFQPERTKGWLLVTMLYIVIT